MGSIYIESSFDASDEASLRTQYNSYTEQQRYEKGHDAYSGALTQDLHVSSRIFLSDQEANDWVSANTDKYGNAFAVKVGDFSKAFFNSTQGKKLLPKFKEIQERVNNYDRDLLLKLKSQKSQFKACSHCNSKINIEFFVKNHKETSCPVCLREFVKTEKHIADQKKLYLSMIEIKKQITVAQKEHEKKLGDKNPYWYIGGWART